GTPPHHPGRPFGDRLRRLGDQRRHEARRRHATHAGDRRGHRRGGAGLSAAPVHDDRRGRADPPGGALVPARQGGGLRVPDRRRAVGRRGLHRHERVGARQCPHRPGRDGVARRRARRGVQVGRGHRDAGRGPRAARGRGLLRPPDPLVRALGPGRHRRPRRAGLRRLADLDLRPSRRRHLHQGRRCRRRSRRQGRGRHPGRRSAQPGDDRRQCGRQRRRLRRHGGR
ncbi:MAG: Pyrophosphate-energized proton pump, partial [uncultured Microvirga sp.]